MASVGPKHRNQRGVKNNTPDEDTVPASNDGTLPSNAALHEMLASLCASHESLRTSQESLRANQAALEERFRLADDRSARMETILLAMQQVMIPKDSSSSLVTTKHAASSPPPVSATEDVPIVLATVMPASSPVASRGMVTPTRATVSPSPVTSPAVSLSMTHANASSNTGPPSAVRHVALSQQLDWLAANPRGSPGFALQHAAELTFVTTLAHSLWPQVEMVDNAVDVSLSMLHANASSSTGPPYSLVQKFPLEARIFASLKRPPDPPHLCRHTFAPPVFISRVSTTFFDPRFRH
jgi:hypothetical protein